jgi:hypothetical protein
MSGVGLILSNSSALIASQDRCDPLYWAGSSVARRSLSARSGNEETMLLQPHNLHWLAEDEPEIDLCAHGAVTVQIGGRLLATAEAGSWCVSAASLCLMRTLTANHTDESPVCDHLIPCCGHSMYAQNDGADVAIVGCFNGLDWEVVHAGANVRLRACVGEEEIVTLGEWRRIVFAFADAVADFYAASAPKRATDETDAQGFAAFQAEWNRRRGLVAAGPGRSISGA